MNARTPVLRSVVEAVWTADRASALAGEPIAVCCAEDFDGISVGIHSLSPPLHPLAPWIIWERIVSRSDARLADRPLVELIDRRYSALLRSYRSRLAATVTTATFPA